MEHLVLAQCDEGVLFTVSLRHAHLLEIIRASPSLRYGTATHGGIHAINHVANPLVNEELGSRVIVGFCGDHLVSPRLSVARVFNPTQNSIICGIVCEICCVRYHPCLSITWKMGSWVMGFEGAKIDHLGLRHCCFLNNADGEKL